MGFTVEGIAIECCYNESPYVGRGLQRRYIVVDDETFEVLVDGENGKGYSSYNGAILAYYRARYGASGRKKINAEHLKLYEWAVVNKQFLERFERIAALYQKEGQPLNADICKKIFTRTEIKCPTTPSKFFKAYQNRFYEEEILKRKKREEQFDRIKSNARLKMGIGDGLDINEKLAGLTYENPRIKKIQETIDRYKKSSLGQLLNPRAKFNFDEVGATEYILEDDTANLIAIGALKEGQHVGDVTDEIEDMPKTEEEQITFDIASAVASIMDKQNKAKTEDTIVSMPSAIEKETAANEFKMTHSHIEIHEDIDEEPKQPQLVSEYVEEFVTEDVSDNIISEENKSLMAEDETLAIRSEEITDIVTPESENADESSAETFDEVSDKVIIPEGKKTPSMFDILNDFDSDVGPKMSDTFAIDLSSLVLDTDTNYKVFEIPIKTKPSHQLQDSNRPTRKIDTRQMKTQIEQQSENEQSLKRHTQTPVRENIESTEIKTKRKISNQKEKPNVKMKLFGQTISLENNRKQRKI